MSAYKVVGPLPKHEFMDAVHLVGEAFTDVQYRYDWCRSGGFDGSTKCFHLVRAADNWKSGFFGIAMSSKEFDMTDHAFVIVDGACLLDGDDRDIRASTLIDAMFEYITSLLNTKVIDLKVGQVFHVHLVGNPLNCEERELFAQLDSRLASHCLKSGWRITSDLVDFSE